MPELSMPALNLWRLTQQAGHASTTLFGGGGQPQTPVFLFTTGGCRSSDEQIRSGHHLSGRAGQEERQRPFAIVIQCSVLLHSRTNSNVIQFGGCAGDSHKPHKTEDAENIKKKSSVDSLP
jgi:hypothetical protein